MPGGKQEPFSRKEHTRKNEPGGGEEAPAGKESREGKNEHALNTLKRFGGLS
jgi:hypothetical protein